MHTFKINKTSTRPTGFNETTEFEFNGNTYIREYYYDEFDHVDIFYYDTDNNECHVDAEDYFDEEDLVKAIVEYQKDKK